jgi:glutamate N-acetyltransferase/amino-acid N-acetyltransferase
LLEICQELARSIPADGEGATHLIVLEVHGCASESAARKIAKTVAESSLVKTAIAGADPNWGRVVSAAGYAEVPFDPAKVQLHVNGHLLYQQGTPVAFDGAAVSASIRGQRETRIVLHFGEGTASTTFWTTDLTAEYVRLNADYHT